MSLTTWKGFLIILVAALVASGAGVYALTAEKATDVGDEVTAEPSIEILQESINGTDTLTVKVGVIVEGKPVPLEGAEIEVFSVNVERTNDTVTIIIDKVAESGTDQHGTAILEIEHGRYLVVAHYEGLVGVRKCNFEEDTHIDMLLHNWLRNNNIWQTGLGNAYQHMDKMTIHIQLEDL